MRVVIVGAGEVGFDVAQMLSQEGHDVVVIEQDSERLLDVRERLDVMAIQGNGATSETMKEAGIERADMVIAVTAVDEVNIIAAMMADRLGVETTIARIRSNEYTHTKSVLRAGDFGIDLVIHPEDSTAEEAARLIRRAGATDVLSFTDGRLQLLGMRIDHDSPVIGKKLKDVAFASQELHYRIMAIRRRGRTILPRGNEKLRRDDQVFALSLTDDIPQVFRLLAGKRERGINHIMILGGGLVGAKIARLLCNEGSKSIKLIEPDHDTAQHLAEELKGVLVLHGDPTDIDLLATEGLGDMDALAAVTDSEESNLVACLMAKQLNVRKTVALLSKRAYIPISQAIGLDAAVNIKLSVSHEVSRFLRGKHVLSVATIHGVDAEILEFRAEAGSTITKGSLKEMSVPKGALIGAVIGDEVQIATGDTEIKAGESVIVFTLPHLTQKVERLFNH